MDLLDRLLGHDSWTTGRLLEISERLTNEELDQEFDIGHRCVRDTLEHVVWNVECWTDLMLGRKVRSRSEDRSIRSLTNRFEEAIHELGSAARQIVDQGKLDETFADTLDNPPQAKSFGGVIVHLATHGMHHRAQLLYMLRRLGVENLPEGDALTWEKTVRVSNE